MKRALAIMAAMAMVFVAGAWSTKPPTSMKLVSPNRRFSITLEATDTGAGVYVWDRNKGVSVYTNTSSGPAVTLYADQTKMPGVALGTEFLQFVDKHQKVRHATIDETGKWKIMEPGK